MPTIKNIEFKSNWQGGLDWLQIEFQFETDELNHPFLVRIGYRRVGPGQNVEAWHDLDECILEPKFSTALKDYRPDISTTSSFQQRVQFKVLVLKTAAKTESIEFPLL